MYYTVLVVGKNIDDQLAPFESNRFGGAEKRFLEFYDTEDRMREEYEMEWIENEMERRENEMEGKEYQMEPKEYETFEEFVEVRLGHEPRDETYNRYGYWENPNRKWDWLGGRETISFQLKDGREGRYCALTDADRATERAYQALKGDVDFEAMRDEAETRAAKRYDAVQEAIKGTPLNESWEVIRARFPKEKRDGFNAHRAYFDQPRVEVFAAFAETERGRDGGQSLATGAGAVDDFNVPREQYLQFARDEAILNSVVLRHGEWLGEWWPYNQGKRIWVTEFNKLVDELPDNELLTLLTCHI